MLENMTYDTRIKNFQQPTEAFRGKPFWAWNDRLNEGELLHQIDVMKKMGFGGFFMHSRTGLVTEYLGDEWFELSRACADKADELGMEAWLYDEDRWPSGSAGGLVTENPEYRQSFIQMFVDEKPWASEASGIVPHWIRSFACRLEQGELVSYRPLEAIETPVEEGESAVHFARVWADCNDNYNGYTYVDTMNEEAIQDYIHRTHDRYSETMSDQFGEPVYGIFTDEPHRGPCFTDFSGGLDARVPYTPTLFERFEERFQEDLRDLLPELFFKQKERPLSQTTWRYFELCQSLFIDHFARPVQQWCKDHGLLLTGHVLHEDTLTAQVTMQGSLMRYYEHMDVPGIDILGEFGNAYWVGKMVSSAARQLNKPWILSELYGCTGWQMNFTSYKAIGDWQALLGVNLRCPHLSWYSMRGEAKRDYPASILHQSPWHLDYTYVEDYYARIHAAMFAGKASLRTLVINPIESVWSRAYAGSFSGLVARDEEIKRLEATYVEVFHYLMEHHVDFDYGDEGLIASMGSVDSQGKLHVGHMEYDQVLIAGVDTMRQSTFDLLRTFTSKGGRVVLVDPRPMAIDTKPSEAFDAWSAEQIHSSLDEHLEELLRHHDDLFLRGEEAKHIYMQTKYLDEGSVTMLLNMDRTSAHHAELWIPHWDDQSQLQRWDPRTGDRYAVEVTEVQDGYARCNLTLPVQGEVIYVVTKVMEALPLEPKSKEGEPIELPQSMAYTLDEPNICVLDLVSLKATIDGEEHIFEGEVLQVDRALRTTLGWPLRGGEMLQPWYEYKKYGEDPSRAIEVELTYILDVTVCPTSVRLALEEVSAISNLRLNGVPIESKSSERWVDACFTVFEMPDNAWQEGSNSLTLTYRLTHSTGIEAMYLLGSFGVALEGATRKLVTLPDQLQIGDISSQGLPFYSGTVSYLLPREVSSESELQFTFTQEGDAVFGGSLVRLRSGYTKELVAFPPYKVCVQKPDSIDVVLTRRNTFGPLHQWPARTGFYGPGNFVTSGDAWRDEYVILPQGLLQAPKIEKM